MKKILLFCLTVFLLASCEEDDICEDPTTPQMKVKFESISDLTALTLDTLVVARIDQDTLTELVNTTAIDSVFLALRIDEVDETQFVFSRTLTNPVYDTLTVSYDRAEVFVSKACGFKIDYLNVNYSSTQNQISGLQAQQNQITNESDTHLIVYY